MKSQHRAYERLPNSWWMPEVRTVHTIIDRPFVRYTWAVVADQYDGPVYTVARGKSWLRKTAWQEVGSIALQTRCSPEHFGESESTSESEGWIRRVRRTLRTARGAIRSIWKTSDFFTE